MIEHQINNCHVLYTLIGLLDHCGNFKGPFTLAILAPRYNAAVNPHRITMGNSHLGGAFYRRRFYRPVLDKSMSTTL